MTKRFVLRLCGAGVGLAAGLALLFGRATAAGAAPGDPVTAMLDGATQLGTETVVRQLQLWACQSAAWGITNAIGFLTMATTPNVAGTSNNWFTVDYRMMMNIGWWIMVPLIICAIIHSIFKGSMQMLLRCVFVYLPMSILGTVVGVEILQMLINVIDDVSSFFLGLADADIKQFFNNVSAGLSDPNVSVVFMLMIAALATMVSIALIIVLIIRDASIYFATMLMPIGFAMLVWPVTAKWFRRIVEFLVGMVLSKLVMAAAVAIGVAGVVATTGQTTAAQQVFANGSTLLTGANNAATTQQPGAAGLGFLIPAVTIMVIACIAPPMTIRLVGNMGMGAMAGNVADFFNRTGPLGQWLFVDRNITGFRQGVAAIRANRRLSTVRAAARNTSDGALRLESLGITPDRAGSYAVTGAQMDRRGITDPGLRDQITHATDGTYNPNDVSRIVAGYVGLGMGGNFAGIVTTPFGHVVRGHDGTSVIVDMDRDFLPENMDNLMRHEIAHQIATYGEVQNIRYFGCPTRYGGIDGLAAAPNPLNDGSPTGRPVNARERANHQARQRWLAGYMAQHPNRIGGTFAPVSSLFDTFAQRDT